MPFFEFLHLIANCNHTAQKKFSRYFLTYFVQCAKCCKSMIYKILLKYLEIRLLNKFGSGLGRTYIGLGSGELTRGRFGDDGILIKILDNNPLCIRNEKCNRIRSVASCCPTRIRTWASRTKI